MTSKGEKKADEVAALPACNVVRCERGCAEAVRLADKGTVCSKCKTRVMSRADMLALLDEEFFCEPSFAIDPKQLGKLMGAELKDMAPSDTAWNTWCSQAKIPFQGYTRGEDMPQIGWLKTALNHLLAMMKTSAHQPVVVMYLDQAFEAMKVYSNLAPIKRMFPRGLPLSLVTHFLLYTDAVIPPASSGYSSHDFSVEDPTDQCAYTSLMIRFGQRAPKIPRPEGGPYSAEPHFRSILDGALAKYLVERRQKMSKLLLERTQFSPPLVAVVLSYAVQPL